VKSVVAVLRNPPEHVVKAITGPLEKYILSELNAWELQLVPKEKEHDWVTLALTPNFAVLGKKLGKKMKDVNNAVRALDHDVSCCTCPDYVLFIGITRILMSLFSLHLNRRQLSVLKKENWKLLVFYLTLRLSWNLSCLFPRKVMNGSRLVVRTGRWL
jgi:isoleucyl-tRNA synthetase